MITTTVATRWMRCLMASHFGIQRAGISRGGLGSWMDMKVSLCEQLDPESSSPRSLVVVRVSA